MTIEKGKKHNVVRPAVAAKPAEQDCTRWCVSSSRELAFPITLTQHHRHYFCGQYYGRLQAGFPWFCSAHTVQSSLAQLRTHDAVFPSSATHTSVQSFCAGCAATERQTRCASSANRRLTARLLQFLHNAFEGVNCHQFMDLAAVFVLHGTGSKARAIRQERALSALFPGTVHPAEFLFCGFIRHPVPYVAKTALGRTMFAEVKAAIRRDDHTAAIRHTVINAEVQSQSQKRCGSESGSFDERTDIPDLKRSDCNRHTRVFPQGQGTAPGSDHHIPHRPVRKKAIHPQHTASSGC